MADAIAPVIRRPGHVAGHSPTFTVELKNEWRYTYDFLCDFIASTGTTLRTPN